MTTHRFCLGAAALLLGLAVEAHDAAAAVDASSARPTATATPKTKARARRAPTTKRGLPMISVSPARPRPATRGPALPKGTTTPTAPEIQMPTLERGDVAELRVDQPIDKAIGLIARGLDRYSPMDPKGVVKGLPFRGGTQSLQSKPRVGFTLASGPLDGDDLRVECTGTLPSTLEIHVTYTSMNQFGGGNASMSIPTSNGTAKFFVHPLSADPWGVLTVELHSDLHGSYSLMGCTIQRDPT